MEEIPTINVVLVIATAFLLVWGRYEVRRKRIDSHRRLMIAATTVFGVFLVLYLVRLIAEGPTPFPGPAAVRPYYYTFLVTHMVLAIATIVGIVPMLVWASKGQYAKHRRLAVWVWPAWLISIAMGVAVYYLLFVVYA